MKKLFNYILISLILISYIGCTSDIDSTIKQKMERSKIIPKVTAMIDQAMLDSDFINKIEGDLVKPKSVDLSNISAKEIVNNVLKSDRGEEFIDFVYSSSFATNPDDILQRARPLVNEEQYKEIEKEVVKAKSAFVTMAKEKAIPKSQRAAFLKDLQQLLVTTIVLLVAGLVYMFIPNVIFWGKIIAAAAIAIAAGVVVVTVMSVVRYYDDGVKLNKKEISFEEWLNEIVKEPAQAYAMAAGIITLGSSLGRDPVVTGIIIIIFAIYNAYKYIRPMLKKYNFRA